MYLVIPFLNIRMNSWWKRVGGWLWLGWGYVELTIFHCYIIENEQFLKLVMM